MKIKPLVISVVNETFGICRLDAFKGIPDTVLSSDFFSVTKTAEELSVVCPESNIPEDCIPELNWKCLKIHGPLDFSQTGIISSLTSSLANSDISVFAFSTYDTDYIMVKDVDLEKAVQALSDSGHQVHK